MCQWNVWNIPNDSHQLGISYVARAIELFIDILLFLIPWNMLACSYTHNDLIMGLASANTSLKNATDCEGKKFSGNIGDDLPGGLVVICRVHSASATALQAYTQLLYSHCWPLSFNRVQGYVDELHRGWGRRLVRWVTRLEPSQPDSSASIVAILELLASPALALTEKVIAK